MVALVVIDLCSAFDTVDHQILLNCLRDTFGISGLVLAWFESYLTMRQNIVNIDGTHSSLKTLQVRVFGPLLFSLYISSIEDTIRSHGMLMASYADDSQVYISIKPPERNDISKRLEACLCDLSACHMSNMLKCSPNLIVSLLN